MDSGVLIKMQSVPAVLGDYIFTHPYLALASTIRKSFKSYTMTTSCLASDGIS